MVRTRIAPSPSGYLHIGTARAALFNYLFAKQKGGMFVLRIENTDEARSKPEYQKDAIDSLRWLGIKPDEGPEEDGPYGPYRQSERLKYYKPVLEKLLENGSAFFCPHAAPDSEDQPRIHWCEYRNGGATSGVIRFKTPRNTVIGFPDLIRGTINFDSEEIGDFSIAKDAGTPLYNLANVVDDYEMRISHVLRGEDHIANTPKQWLLQEALKIPRPDYGHLPLVLGEDRSKLSKRHGAVSISEYRQEGYLPEALVNFMALLGWNSGTDREFFTLNELVREFSIDKIQKSGAVFNIVKLGWMNGEYVRKKTAAELAELCMPYVKEAAPHAKIENSYLEKVVALEQPRLKKLSEIGEHADFFFKEPEYEKGLLRWKDMNDQEVLRSLKFSEDLLNSKGEIEKIFLDAIGNGDKGKILWPLRVALSGKKASPGPFEIIEVLGVKESLKRIGKAVKKIRE